MTRHLTGLLMLPVLACAQEPTARQVLDGVISTYANVKAVHMVAEREEARYVNGRVQSAFSECELAAKPGHRYFARLKQPSGQALAVSDGSNSWRALDSKKQWSKVSAAAVGDDSGEDPDAKTANRDLHDSLRDIMLSHVAGLAKAAKEPALVKQQDFKLGREKVRCYVIRAHTGQTEFELTVDRESFVVVEYREKVEAPEGLVEIITRLKLAALNQEVSDSLFHFEPPGGWTEVETLTLPGERYFLLTGQRAADFVLKTLEGDTVALRTLTGSVVVLDFWATWCGPCREEFPAMERLRAEFGEAVRFYGLSDEAPATVKKFVTENRYQMPVLLDPNREIHRRYGIRAIPALFVIDRDGVVRRQYAGTQSEAELRKAIRLTIGQK